MPEPLWVGIGGLIMETFVHRPGSRLDHLVVYSFDPPVIVYVYRKAT